MSEQTQSDVEYGTEPVTSITPATRDELLYSLLRPAEFFLRKGEADDQSVTKDLGEIQSKVWPQIAKAVGAQPQHFEPTSNKADYGEEIARIMTRFGYEVAPLDA